MEPHILYIVTYLRMTIDGVWIGELDLLTTYTQHSELQILTELSFISTLHKSLQHPLSLFPACCAFISRSLATDYNSGDSSASRAQVLSSQPPVQNSTLNRQLTKYWVKIKVRVKVTLRLAVYCHSLRLGVKLLENQTRVFLSAEPLRS
jgi:hypothetical protein